MTHDLHQWRFEPSYENWEYHGGSSSDSLVYSDFKDNDIYNCARYEMSDDAHTFAMLYDILQSFKENRKDVFDHLISSKIDEEPNKEVKKFYGVVNDAQQTLYLGCKNFCKLSFIMRLFQMKCLYG